MSRRATITEASFAGYRARAGVRDTFPRLPRNGVHAQGAVTFGALEAEAHWRRRQRAWRRAARIARLLHWTASAIRIGFWSTVVLFAMWLLSAMSLVVFP